MIDPDNNPRKKRRAVYLLPNLFTTGALFSGFYAVVSAMHQHFEAAAIAIFVAMILDGFDGRVARMINAESDFGAQYDSLSDVVAFGVAPALVSLSWGLSTLGKVGWMAAFIYLACAALRLARFNTQIAIVDKKYFIGLASPPAAAVVAGLVWFSTDSEIPADILAIPGAIMVAGAGLLMVSNIKYSSFKNFNIENKVPFMVFLGVIVVGSIIIVDPAKILFGCALCYALSGPFLVIKNRIKRKHSVASE
jgi:CDP-diacylglycerol--serine O-phosphatidyltransferase